MFYSKEFFKTLKLGEKLKLKGVYGKSENLRELKDIMWEYLARKFGVFEFYSLSPYPDPKAPSIIVMINEKTEIYGKGPYAIVEGVVDDFYKYSPFSGRFVICERFEKVGFEKIFELKKPEVSTSAIQTIFFGDKFQESLLSLTMSSPKYMDRAGGNGLTVFRTMEKDFPEMGKIKKILGEYYSQLHPILKLKSMQMRVNYELPFEISYRVRIESPVRIKKYTVEKVRGYLIKRKVRGELSVFTHFEIGNDMLNNTENFYNSKYNKILTFSEIPILPYREEMWVPEIRDYSLDLAYYTLYNHFAMPTQVIPEEKIKYGVKKIEEYTSSYLPVLYEAMQYGFLVDVSKIGGIWEHLSRIAHSYMRVGFDVDYSIQKAIELYIELFERIYDSMEKPMRIFLASQTDKNRVEKIISDVLFKLSIYRPGGWSYQEFQEEMELRGFEPSHIEKILNALISSARIYEVGINRYKVV